MSDFQSKKMILPDSAAEWVGTKNWNCWLSPSSPVNFYDSRARRCQYASWLGDERGITSGKGIYIWLAPRPTANGYRFIHVGLSTKGGSTLAKRTKAHCRNQFNGMDRVHKLSGTGFGTLGRDLSKTDEGICTAIQFMNGLRVLYIEKPENVSELAVRRLEGVIACTAQQMLGEREITNTMSKVTAWGDCLDGYIGVAEALNTVEPMLPSQK